MRFPWNGNIETARESETMELSEEKYDGTREYGNGTYGQSDYTVRERDDDSGLSDVYIESDSEQNHSHDVIDEDGNLVESYHDYIAFQIAEKMIEELINNEEDLSDSLTRKLTIR